MTGLSTEVKTHVIITHSGSHYFVTAEKERKLELVGLDDLFDVDGENKIKGSSIAEVVTVAKYYELYPEKQTHSYGQPPSKVEIPDTRDGRGFYERMFEWYEKHPAAKQTKGYDFFMEAYRKRKIRQ